MRERLPLLVGLTLIAVALGVGSDLIANGIRDRGQNDVLTVTGSAKQRITSDYVIWTSHVSSQQPTPAAAATEITTWTARVRAFFQAQGVEASELTLAPVSASLPGSYASDGGKVKGYLLERDFEIRSARVAAIAHVAEESRSLLAEGVPLAVDPPQYVYTKLPTLRPKLLAAAMKDAQARAKVLVAAGGVKLGHLRGVDVGVFQVTAPNSTDVSDYGTYDTSTLQKDVTAVVNVTFAVG